MGDGLHDVVEQEAAKAGIKLSLLSIPREAMDKRAVDAGDIQFFELAYLETELKKLAHGYQISLPILLSQIWIWFLKR